MRALFIRVAAVVFFVTAAGSAIAQQEFEGWNLEPGISQAHLVMVARVTSISRVTIVEGAKTDIALREFRFQPVRVLKGLFQRDELSMTASDLGLPAQDASVEPPLKEGEIRLLILTQPRGLNTYGCVSAAAGARTFGERVPLLASPDDPLVAVADTLIRVVDSRSRKERATLLLDRLLSTASGSPTVPVNGLASVPLLTSLKARADWAASDGRFYEPIRVSPGNPPAPNAAVFYTRRNQPDQVRTAAVELLNEMLASGNIDTKKEHIEVVANALRQIIEDEGGSTANRVAVLEALDHLLSRNLLARGVKLPWAEDLLSGEIEGAATYAERVVAFKALSHVAGDGAKHAILDIVQDLPLDESPTREEHFLQAALRSVPAEADRLVRDRLQRSLAAGQPIGPEIEALLVTKNPETVQILIKAAGRVNGELRDRQAMAKAFGAFADNRAVPVLAYWVRRDSNQLGTAALRALEAIDSDAAAREIRPLLKTEPQLATKLRIARLLARHRINDGYALATEHLADTDFTASAALVLAALDDPRTVTDLKTILEGAPDRRWHAAALTGLVAVGDEAGKEQLLAILNDERHPLTADAAQAVGLSADPDLLPPLVKLVQSRNPQIAMSSLVALRRFFRSVRTSPHGLDEVEFDKRQPTPPSVPQATRDELAQAVASLIVDPYVAMNMRQEAFAVSQLLGGDDFEELLVELADQAELEGTALLAAVQAARRKQRDFLETILCKTDARTHEVSDRFRPSRARVLPTTNCESSTKAANKRRSPTPSGNLTSIPRAASPR